MVQVHSKLRLRRLENTVSMLSLCVLFWNRSRYLRKRSVDNSSNLKKQDPIWRDVQLLDCLAFIPAILGTGRLVVNSKQLQALWSKMYTSYTGEQLFRLYFVFTVVFYFAIGGASLLVDVLKPKVFRRRFKYQKSESLDLAKLPKLLLYLSINIAGPITYVILAQGIERLVHAPTGKQLWELLVKAETHPSMQALYHVSKEVPSFFTIWKDSLVFLAVYEMVGYYTHRVLHLPFFYKHVHKIHHEWKSPIALAAAYAHPFEYAISNVSPALVTSYLLRPHLLSLASYSALGIMITLSVHCGYGILGSEWWDHHDKHHQYYRWNYGFLSIADRLHGTQHTFNS